MSRMNWRSRAKAKQAAFLAATRDSYGPSHDDSAMLQRGSPRTSSGSKFDRNGVYAMNAPRPTFEPDYTKGTPTRVQPARIVMPDMSKAPEMGRTGLAKVLK